MDSQHDGRSKHILINKGLVPDAGDLLVDVVTYGPEVACPEHYHEGTDHFFYILEGDGVLEVEGEEHDIEAARSPGSARGTDTDCSPERASR
ncbi:cupin domain-containing protein [Saliphagus sp. GCM10025308]